MDKSREQFEKWMSDDGKYSLAIEKTGEDYILATTRVQWEAWKASRAEVEVEIPEVEKWRSPEAVRAQRAMLVLVKQAISDAGLKVKGE
ncbi:TPA: hypothetical protein PTV62_004424 [Cronobacter sakazakii]|uniref:hypothetical protein n=1 Tax=Cronobacter sakazakii TaxID=28141 RepID=UPI001375F27D|nr:hypothetical protein [Cronobacter sakazakii]EJJ0118049.1 hypothetical protein [Cronobacter sakazakii]EMC4146457.1 hypothetical protein [Cronobacter sakazakii]EMC4238801.1 hypothetical protein [Cronobacter sakazakii]EMC4247071.1 hypothetical protein [Cronobacter sakazakii]EMC4251242.1 hypothetical protein [Cronobacter sakazakii]